MQCNAIKMRLEGVGSLIVASGFKLVASLPSNSHGFKKKGKRERKSFFVSCQKASAFNHFTRTKKKKTTTTGQDQEERKRNALRGANGLS